MSGQARAAEAMAPVPGSTGCWGLAKRPCWDSGRVNRRPGLGDRKSPLAGPERPPSGSSLPDHLPRRPPAPAPAPMGLTLSLSLSAPSCFPSEVENGSLVTNMASGHWVMRSLFPLPRTTKGPFVPLPAPLSRALPRPPTHPISLLPAPPAPRCTPGLRGVTVAWPWRPPSPRAPWEEQGPCVRGGHFESGLSRQNLGFWEAAVGGRWGSTWVLWVPLVLQGEGAPFPP